MQQHNYLIEYTVYDINGNSLKTGKMRVKRKCSSMEAQVEFEKFLKRKYSNFNKLVVHKCTEENPFLSSDMNDSFKDIFGDSFNDVFGNLFK